MKSSGRKKRKAGEVPQENYKQTAAEQKKSANRNCRRSQKAPGEGKFSALGKDQKVKPPCVAKSSSQCKSLPEMPRVSDICLQTGEIVSSAKMKLQLFPVNEATCIRLEKDGHNPFLELTLSARKKISSVIKHLNSKWGSSSAAIGELMLFPYNTRPEDFSASRMWTSDNGGIAAGELHKVLESPPVFRLRYGWFSNLHSEAPGIFGASVEACSEYKIIGKTYNSFSSIGNCLSEELKVDSQEIRNSFDVHKAGDVASNEEAGVAAPAEHLDDEVIVHSAPAQSMVPWDDSLTSLSIGGLLSESSLLNKMSNSTLKSDSKSGLHPILLSDISIGGLLYEASLQEKINKPKLKSENKCGLQSIESIAEMSTGGLLSDISSQKKTDNPDLKTEKVGLHPFHSASEISIGGLLSEASLQGKISDHDATFDTKTLGLQPLKENTVARSLWDDDLTTLSIGGLLSEASLEARIPNSDPKLLGSTTNSQSRIPNFDSFDAFLAAQFNSQPQTPRPSLLDFHAEDTCHAFPIQKLSSFSKDSKVSNEIDTSTGFFEDSKSKTLRLPRRDKQKTRKDSLSCPSEGGKDRALG